MEKLIELLNEYVKQLGIGDYVGWHNEKTVRNSEHYILTKKFGFIKRLVDNDKIDFDNKLQVLKDIDVRGEVLYDYKLYEKDEGVIMLLAISDTPIEDLLSYLK